MADVSGLILGAIALASLFSTCIELFECFELGRNYAYDYQLACTKVALLKARLSTWGAALSIGRPGHEHPALRLHWVEEQEVIGRSLFGIKEIFENASLLAEKYKLTPRHSRALSSAILHQAKATETTAGPTTPEKTSRTSWTFLRKRTIWAIHDKQKFDGFIQDLSFLIENLEKVTERIAMSTLQKDPAFAKPSRHSDLDQQALVLAHRDNPRKEKKVPSHQPVKHSTNPPKHLYPTEERLNPNEVAMRLDGAVFTGSQQTDKGAVVMGSVGKSDKRRNMYTGDQKVTGNGLGVMGNVSEKAALYLQQPNRRRKQELAAHDQWEDSETDDSSVSSEEETRRAGSKEMRLAKR